MKVAIVGDPHIAVGFRARIDNYLKAVLDKLEYVIKENDIVITLGDVFDTNTVPTHVFNTVYSRLEPYKGKIHTIIGNHDLFHRNMSTMYRTSIGSMALTKAMIIHTEPFEIDGVWFVPVMTDDKFEKIPVDEKNKRVLLCHKYFEMLVCPEESLDRNELIALDYKYVFMGHDHQSYEPMQIEDTTLFRPGSLTRHTVDIYNENRKIHYYQLDTKNMEVTDMPIPYLPSKEVYINGSFNRTEIQRVKTDSRNLAQLLARFDRRQVSNLSLEATMRGLGASNAEIEYIKGLHKLHGIKYN